MELMGGVTDWDGETEWRRIGKKVAMGTKFNESLFCFLIIIKSHPVLPVHLPSRASPMSHAPLPSADLP